MTIRHKTFPLIILIAFFVCAQFVGQAFSASITINNSSFEADIPDSYWIEDPIRGNFAYFVPDWYSTEYVSTFRPTTYAFPNGVPDGQNCVSVDNNQWLGQTLSENLEVGTYTLKVWVGYRNDDDVYLSAYDIELLAGGNLLSSNSGPIPAKGTFEERIISYTANSGDPNLGQPLGITFRFHAVGNFGYEQAVFDYVSLNFTPSNVTPIPSNVFLLGSGLIGLLSWRRYKKN